MKRMVGFAIFFIAVGVLIALLLSSELISILIMLFCLLLSYYLLCF